MKGEPAGLSLASAVMFVTDLDRSVAFYKELLAWTVGVQEFDRSLGLADCFPPLLAMELRVRMECQEGAKRRLSSAGEVGLIVRPEAWLDHVWHRSPTRRFGRPGLDWIASPAHWPRPRARCPMTRGSAAGAVPARATAGNRPGYQESRAVRHPRGSGGATFRCW